MASGLALFKYDLQVACKFCVKISNSVLGLISSVQRASHVWKMPRARNRNVKKKLSADLVEAIVSNNTEVVKALVARGAKFNVAFTDISVFDKAISTENLCECCEISTHPL
jgi:hypothetical protein